MSSIWTLARSRSCSRLHALRADLQPRGGALGLGHGARAVALRLGLLRRALHGGRGAPAEREQAAVLCPLYRVKNCIMSFTSFSRVVSALSKLVLSKRKKGREEKEIENHEKS